MTEEQQDNLLTNIVNVMNKYHSPDVPFKMVDIKLNRFQTVRGAEIQPVDENTYVPLEFDQYEKANLELNSGSHRVALCGKHLYIMLDIDEEDYIFSVHSNSFEYVIKD